VAADVLFPDKCLRLSVLRELQGVDSRVFIKAASIGVASTAKPLPTCLRFFHRSPAFLISSLSVTSHEILFPSLRKELKLHFIITFFPQKKSAENSALFLP
jgi:3-deoxy-D-manno-octulosonic-acid transferase